MKVTEFQAVILAAGRGSRMTDLIGKIPKALLPVANMPLIWYPAKMLENAGFEEAIVITQRHHQNDIQKALSDTCQLRLDFVSIPPDVDWGTADSLRHIKDKIRSDLVVVSCDLITDVPLHRLADLHRTHNSTVTMLLGSLLDMTDVAVPGGKANKKIEKDLVGLDEKGNRVLFFSSEADYEETVSFRKSLFKRHPCIQMHTRLWDGHLYFMKHWVLDLLAQEESMATIKGELVPYLVRQQFTQPKSAANDSHPADASMLPTDTRPADIHSMAEEDDLMQLAMDMSSYCSDTTLTTRAAPEKIRCYAYVHEDGLCLRANSLVTYCEANRQVPRQLSCFYGDQEVTMVHPSAVKHQRSTIGPDSMVAEQTEIAEKVGIKRCIIGPHCRIGEKVRITNSIIMDHVTIDEGCNLTGCIVCENVSIREKSELKDCLVGSSQNIMPMGKFSNEVIVDLNRMMEI